MDNTFGDGPSNGLVKSNPVDLSATVAAFAQIQDVIRKITESTEALQSLQQQQQHHASVLSGIYETIKVHENALGSIAELSPSEKKLIALLRINDEQKQQVKPSIAPFPQSVVSQQPSTLDTPIKPITNASWTTPVSSENNMDQGFQQSVLSDGTTNTLEPLPKKEITGPLLTQNYTSGEQMTQPTLQKQSAEEFVSQVTPLVFPKAASYSFSTKGQ